MKTPTDNKVVSITENNNSLESRLRDDAKSLVADVDEASRDQLFQQLKNQSPMAKQSPTFSSLSVLPYALVAGLAVCVISATLFFNQDIQTNQSPQIAQSPATSGDSPSKKSSFLIASLSGEKKLASEELQSEYKAFLQDMDKLKNRIVAL